MSSKKQEKIELLSKLFSDYFLSKKFDNLEFYGVSIEYEDGELNLIVFVDIVFVSDEVTHLDLDMCTSVSEQLSEFLDNNEEFEAIIPKAYNLIVSTPGADRVLRSVSEAKRHIGRLCIVFLNAGDAISKYAIGEQFTVRIKDLTESELECTYYKPPAKKGQKIKEIDMKIAISDIERIKLELEF